MLSHCRVPRRQRLFIPACLGNFYFVILFFKSKCGLDWGTGSCKVHRSNRTGCCENVTKYSRSVALWKIQISSFYFDIRTKTSFKILDTSRNSVFVWSDLSWRTSWFVFFLPVLPLFHRTPNCIFALLPNYSVTHCLDDCLRYINSIC